MQQQCIDKLTLVDPENDQEVLIFNFYSWSKIIEAIIVKYADKSPHEARKLLLSSNVYKHAARSYLSAVLTAHETEYHWAMLIAYGELYWHRGIHSNEPQDFDEWEQQYRVEHQLAKESFEFQYSD